MKLVYISVVERIIRVTSDLISSERVRLLSIAHSAEKKALCEYRLKGKLFEDIIIAPSKDGVLGLFSADDRIIIINESVMALAEKDRDNILLHELAHALDKAINGSCSGHSPQFRSYALFLGIEQGFEKARIKTALAQKEKNESRIAKLLQLSSSPFENEAIEALKKAQKLMAENHSDGSRCEKKLYYVPLYESGRTPYYISRILSFISDITGVFIVRSSSEGKVVSTGYGKLEEVELAIYLFDSLSSQLDKEARKARREGRTFTKDSFIIGAIPEMEKKISENQEGTKSALMVIRDENIRLSKELVFRKTSLRTVRHSAHILDKNCMKSGSEFGKAVDLPIEIRQRLLGL